MYRRCNTERSGERRGGEPREGQLLYSVISSGVSPLPYSAILPDNSGRAYLATNQRSTTLLCHFDWSQRPLVDFSLCHFERSREIYLNTLVDMSVIVML